MDRVRRGLAASAALMTASGLLAACSAGASSGRHADLVHQPRRRGPGQGRGELQHRRLHDRGAGPAAERQRAAHPALAAAGGGGPRDRHHEHRPALHRGVRERRLPGRDPRRPAGQAASSSPSRARSTPPPGTASWSSPRSGPTPRCSGTASRSPRRPAST